MTTGDEEAENLVDNLLNDVDDQFQDLEREYNQAREGIVVAEQERRGPSNPLEASNERFELLSQVADLQAEIARQGDELDERDRMLAELGEQIAGFQADIAERDEMLEELHEAKQAVLEERREQARIQALLDARAVERQELADVAQRMQNERDNVQELLTTAMERNDEIEAARLELDDAVRHLEAARDTAAQEHDARAHELIDARAEISKLEDQLETALQQGKAAGVKAEKSEALAERRGNEAGYLNRRIEALNEKLENASGFETLVAEMRRQANIDERRISELDRNIVSLQGELEAANAAVDAIATRTRDYDELVTKVGTLEKERDAAWEAASGHAPAGDANVEADADDDAEAIERSENAERAADLAARARELGARRAKEAAAAAEAAEKAAAEHAKIQAQKALVAEQAAAQARAAAQNKTGAPAPSVEVEEEPVIELVDLEAEDLSVIDSDLAALDLDSAEATAERTENPTAAQYIAELDELAEPAAPVSAAPEPVAEKPAPVAAPTFEEIPRIEYPAPAPQFVFEQSSPDPDDVSSTNEVPVIHAPIVDAADAEPPSIEAPPVEVRQVPVTQIQLPPVEIPQVEVPQVAPPVVESPIMAAPTMAPPTIPAPTMPAPTTPLGDVAAMRKRTILPTDLVPNTEQAVAFLLNQPGVIAIVDARSTCGRTGVRPSELFDRVAALRDHFDVPVEVVVTPVSTPVGGAPDLPAIGVHHVTGADTVADRIRALCMGFPADQPLVVVAGDDHVRRAAIGEEANVVEPSAVLDFLAE